MPATMLESPSMRCGKAGGRRSAGRWRLFVAALLGLVAALPAAAQNVPLSADQIVAALAGNSLTGYWQNAQLKQYFAADGSARQQRNREALVDGRWWVERPDNLLCTEYPSIAERRCYSVRRQGEKLVLFEAETGYPLVGSVVAGDVLAGVAIPNESSDDGGRPPGAVRTVLTRSQLEADRYVGAARVLNAHFMPVGAAMPARHNLAGRLRVPDFALQGRIELGRGYEWFPGFEADIFSDGETLVPVERGLLRSKDSKSALSVILSPGKVWSEAADGGLSRAAFPFLLANPAEDSAHNGIATFLFDDASVSALRIQLVQEIAPAYKLDAWGQTPMRYRPGPVPQAARRQFGAERQAATPTAPWSALAQKYGAEALAGFDGGTLADDLSVAGLIVDGTAYLMPCRSRQGPFPFCTAMRQGASAMATAFAAGLSLLHLGQRFGGWVLDQRIAATLPAAARNRGWSRVTFIDALNMATGIGQPAAPNLLTPAAMHARRSREAATLAEKLDWVLRDPPGTAAPGEAFNEREGDTLVLAAAMDGFLKREAGPDADLWRAVSAAVLAPAGIAELPLARTREADGSPGLPPMNGGLYLDVDDVAKLAALFQARGRVGGQQLLLAEPLDRLMDFSAEKGLETGIAGRRYYLGFWLWPWRDPAGACRLWLPVTAGGVGQLVVLLPHGMTAFRFADDRRLPVTEMANVANRIKPFCEH
jgi:hypothetical protein